MYECLNITDRRICMVCGGHVMVFCQCYVAMVTNGPCIRTIVGSILTANM